jgi:hypothetical protein
MGMALKFLLFFLSFNATACGDEKAASQFFIMYGVGGVAELSRSFFERTPFLLFAVCLFQSMRGAFGLNRLQVNSKLYERDKWLSEQRVETKEQLAAHGFELLLPGRVSDGDDERLAIEPEGHGLPAQALARDPAPCHHRRSLADLFRLACGAQKFRQRSNQVFHKSFWVLDFRFLIDERLNDLEFKTRNCFNQKSQIKNLKFA